MKLIKLIVKEDLYNNSLWLIADSVILTIFGFFFWTINARLFSSEQIGIASALIVTAELLVAISMLGFDIAIIRYITNMSKKNLIINSCFSLAGITAFLISIIFVLNIGFFSPKLSLLENNIFGVLFVIFVVFNILFELMGAVFIGLRKSKFTFILDAIFSIVKLIFPFVFVFLGAFGIFSSWMISIIISLVVGLIFFDLALKFEIHKETIKKMFKFSIANYLSNLLSRAPSLLLPLLIANLINPVTTAYFYIAWMITSVLFIIPSSISKSLLAQGNMSKKSLRNNVKKSIYFTFLLLIPAVIIMVFSSKYLLLLFGSEYSINAFRLLQILALSSIPYAVVVIYTTIKNVKHEINVVLAINFLIAASTLSLSYLFIDYGILMIGVFWLVTQIVAAIYSALKLIKID